MRDWQFYPIDYVARDICLVCKQFFEYSRNPNSPRRLCHACFFAVPHEPVAGAVTDGDTTIVVSSVVPYEDWPRILVHDLKYQWKFSCVRDLAYFLELAFWSVCDQFTSYPTLVPIPLHWTRRWARGYNQSEILAEALAQRVGIPHVSSSSLVRCRRTKPQHGLSKEERQRNIKSAFAVPPNSQVPETVILIDDVLTTGSTLLQAAKPLYERGAQQVFALTPTRALLQKEESATPRS